MSENFKRYLNCYEWETTLPGSGKVLKYKPITTGQIKRLLLYSDMEDNKSIESALDNLISECVVSEGFDVKELYLPDRFYLMIEIRCATKGYKYTFQTRCLKCNSQSQNTVDISTLPVKKLGKNDNLLEVKIKAPEKEKQVIKKGKLELVTNDAPVVIENVSTNEIKDVINDKKLPWNYVKLNDNVSVTLSPLTRGIELACEEMLKDKELTDEQRDVEMSLLGYAMAIENIITPAGVEENITLENKIFLIENITPPEKEILDKWFNDNLFGIDFKFKVKCIHCSEETERVIPLQDFFY